MSEENFSVWPELSSGKVEIVKWPLSTVFFVDDANFPGWLVLVPRRANVEELHRLSTDDQVQAAKEQSWAALALDDLYKPTKINIGALGNVVRQLHIHVLARWNTDAAWPGKSLFWGIITIREA